MRLEVYSKVSADDFINPPELDLAEKPIKRVKKSMLVTIPISDETHAPSHPTLMG